MTGKMFVFVLMLTWHTGEGRPLVVFKSAATCMKAADVARDVNLQAMEALSKLEAKTDMERRVVQEQREKLKRVKYECRRTEFSDREVGGE